MEAKLGFGPYDFGKLGCRVSLLGLLAGSHSDVRCDVIPCRPERRQFRPLITAVIDLSFRWFETSRSGGRGTRVRRRPHPNGWPLMPTIATRARQAFPVLDQPQIVTARRFAVGEERRLAPAEVIYRAGDRNVT